ncbi:head-tail adaptor protein [uncultured Imperialibacter sp.]|uniref:head-tail adaptor protein n=1 Tax=uncultured Imperialibacter sp. TaxID=1672639 RepID=UPI0030DB890E|tara:strand:- start:8428 stop:8760 length:333 start_codon:yes stop_codon:yes gene_type:complete
MLAGKLDRPITIEHKVITRDSIGQEIESWTGDSVVHWATVTPASNGYKVTQGAIESLFGKTQFYIRYNSSITYHSRIVYNGDYFYPEDIHEVGRAEAMKIIASNRSTDNP